MKKKSINNDDPSINFKLPKELREQVVREAQLVNSTVSNYLRNHLVDFYSGKLFEEKSLFDHSLELINSTEFLQLVVWVFSKRNNEICTSTNNQLNGYIRTIKKLDNNLPRDLVVEFDKVLMDLIRVQSEKNTFRSFKFCKSNYDTSLFDYDKLENFLLNEAQSYYAEKI